MHSDQSSRNMAMLALAAGNDTDSCECPSDEALAAYIDGIVNANMKRDITAHLNGCNRCREQWLEVSNVITNVEEEPVPIETKHILTYVIHQLQHWFSQVTVPITVPATATVLLVVMLTLLMSGSPSVTNRLDIKYARLSAQFNGSSKYHPLKYQASLPLPWETTALAFNLTPANEAQRAFGAGLWQGQLDLGVNDNRVAQNPFPPTNACCWEKTQWIDYYLLGRWLGLLWWQTWLIEQGDLTDPISSLTIDWAEHREILASLRNNFNSIPRNIYLSNTLIELGRLTPQLANPVDVTTLQRQVLHVVHRLGPTAL